MNKNQIKKPFKSNLKVKYDNIIGMWVVNGKSLTRDDTDGKAFYDKSSADNFKYTIDKQDYYFTRDHN